MYARLPDYDETECTEQDCDETSAGYDFNLCELGNCDPSSPNYNDTECEVSTCNTNSPNYDETQCALQDCDPSSAEYDDELCDQGTCDQSSPNYEPAVCNEWNCPCLTGLPLTPTGGIIRNANGDIIRSVGTFTQQFSWINGFNITYRTDYIMSANGHSYPIQTIVSVTDANGNTTYPWDVGSAAYNLSFNCLGYALADGQFVLGSQQSDLINAVLGITSASSALSDGTFSNDFNHIQPGQILIVI